MSLFLAGASDPESVAFWVADPNPRAQAFYRKHGFIADGTAQIEDGVREIPDGPRHLTPVTRVSSSHSKLTRPSIRSRHPRRRPRFRIEISRLMYLLALPLVSLAPEPLSGTDGFETDPRGSEVPSRGEGMGSVSGLPPEAGVRVLVHFRDQWTDPSLRLDQVI